MAEKLQEVTQSIPDAVPSTLIPELLGFSPHFLLDDIISAAADAIFNCIQAVEVFMQSWATKRAEKVGNDWDGREEVEQGLVAFTTLLEFHTDIAFDFFEAWSKRNIFAVPPDLPLVAPHHRGLNLHTKAEGETELMAEIEDLRRKIENQRRLKRMYRKALRISRVGLLRSQRRVERLSYLSDEQAVSALRALPPQVVELFENAASLPHLDLSMTGTPPLPDPSKRLWETGKAGYINWAVGQLIAKSKEQVPSAGGSTAVGNVVEQASAVGKAKDVKAFTKILKEEEGRTREDGMDTT